MPRHCREICPPGAIDLDMTEEEIEVEVGAVIVATGWRPYDATKLDNLGFGQYPNVITNVMMERLAAEGGPTGGEIIRPSDGKKAENVAFVQCAGSRDENHLPYCSAVCCMASLKQARYLERKERERQGHRFSTSTFVPSVVLEKFYYDMLEDENVSFVKGKVAEINEDPEKQGSDAGGGRHDCRARNCTQKFDMVVLATGIVPNTADVKIPFELKYDDYGFIDGTTDVDGIYAAGCVKRPCDVSRATKDSTAAALKAIQCLNRRVITMEDKIGVFICTGYGIAEALDIDALCKVATEEYGVAVLQDRGFLRRARPGSHQRGYQERRPDQSGHRRNLPPSLR